MRISFFIVTGLVLLVQLFPAREGAYRRLRCMKMDGRCEAECLTFEVRIGGCRSELTPFCCKRRVYFKN
ncbi:beta-defensin 107A-like [Perognathus longimembris pacificus]|uniref:beta-defensin 107A-like n=1 Tax=Perognathus longimembris pacificus TaxID=214514 RepID=UPI00201949BF|nr:beta-defensin 107A-like [Perognathus longimembris pacificus]